jgi:hypothetical protein
VATELSDVQGLFSSYYKAVKDLSKTRNYVSAGHLVQVGRALAHRIDSSAQVIQHLQMRTVSPLDITRAIHKAVNAIDFLQRRAIRSSDILPELHDYVQVKSEIDKISSALSEMYELGKKAQLIK